MSLGKILASPFGTFLKMFVFTFLTLVLYEFQNGRTFFTWDIKMLDSVFTNALVSALPILINWFNPKYKNYGK